MSKVNSTARALADKPAKPYPDFPLFAHATKRWAKKIRGKMHYFGPWDDPDGALKNYLDQKDALHAGRKPRVAIDGTTVKELCNRFLNLKQQMVNNGELSPLTWQDYHHACASIVAAFGKTRLVSDLGPDDFTTLRHRLTRNCGPHRLGKMISCIRCVFKHAYDSTLVSVPIHFGPGFKGPSKKTMRLHRASKGPRMFEADELLKLIGAANVRLRAMIYLGINCGFGNADCGTLPISALDLDGGWLNYPRPKTGVPRRCWLWRETVQAIREALAMRPSPKDAADADLVFITLFGERWSKDDNYNPISRQMRRLLRRLGINGNRSFYALRHTLETVGGEAKDQVAVDAIMGHVRDDMASVYRERISDDRLRAVADFVRQWLFAKPRIAATEMPDEERRAV